MDEMYRIRLTARTAMDVALSDTMIAHRRAESNVRTVHVGSGEAHVWTCGLCAGIYGYEYKWHSGTQPSCAVGGGLHVERLCACVATACKAP